MHIKPSDRDTSQQQNHSGLANIAIIGCGYVGTAASRYWYQQKTHTEGLRVKSLCYRA